MSPRQDAQERCHKLSCPDDSYRKLSSKMFSFLRLLYTGEFKADGWILITVETEELYFYLDATARPEKIHFSGLKESSALKSSVSLWPLWPLQSVDTTEKRKK